MGQWANLGALAGFGQAGEGLGRLLSCEECECEGWEVQVDLGCSVLGR